MNYHVYLAGPIAGTQFKECVDWRKDFIRDMPNCITCLSPMRGKEECFHNTELIEASHYNTGPALARDSAILSRDHFDCKRADVIIFNLWNAKRVSIGTMMELAWAWSYQKPSIIIYEDRDLHDHPMVRAATSFRADSIAEAKHLTRIILEVPYSTDMEPKEQTCTNTMTTTNV